MPGYHTKYLGILHNLSSCSCDGYICSHRLP